MINEVKKVFDAIHKLHFILSREQKIYCVIVFVMSLISAFFEILGVSIVVPLLMVIMNIEQLKENALAVTVFDFFHATTNTQIILLICCGIAVIYIAKNAFSIFYVWVSAKLSSKIRRELSLKVFEAYIKQGYGYFSNSNSSLILRGISSDPDSVQIIVSNMFLLMVRVITVLCIFVYIVVQTPYMALILLIFAAGSFGISELIFKNRMKKYGEQQRHYSRLARQDSLEAIQGSKEVFACNRQNYFTEEYRRCMAKYDNACANAAVGAAAPTHILEAVCVSGLVFAVAFQAVGTGNTEELITKLATIAIAAFRLLPYLGAIMGSVNTIVYNAPGLGAAYNTLYKVEQMENKKIKKKYSEKRENMSQLNVRFQKEIQIKDISFSYEEDSGKVLDGLNMKIRKGTSIGLIGTTGAGKTTLADLILSLYKPQSGKICMDGMDIEDIGANWHQIIGYVPQSIYLCDASVRRNVAFGIEESKIDDDKVWKALEMAQIKPFVESLKDGLDTRVGEWGVKFSGGQKQRIAIARALYSDPDILVMDEATAALDNETEKAVMESIEALQGIKTLIIVAHRLTTIKQCDEIYEIVGGKAVRRMAEEVFGEKLR